MQNARILRAKLAQTKTYRFHLAEIMDKTTPEHIYEDLKHRIIWLELKPEALLNQSRLAQAYGVSRNPVTLALTRLEAEGWAVRRGSHFMVSPLGLAGIRENTEIRLALEVPASLWALRRMTPDILEKLKKLKNRIQHLAANTSNRKIVEMDLEFHRLLFAAARNQQAAGMLERLLSQYFRFWLSFPREIDKHVFFIQTLDMIRAVEEKDEKTMETACRRHIRESVEEIFR